MSVHKIDARISVNQDEGLSDEEKAKKQLADQKRSDETIASQQLINIAKFKEELAKKNQG